jgi:hypothetical protein
MRSFSNWYTGIQEITLFFKSKDSSLLQ